MKNIIELQRKTQDLIDDIRDILHAASINFRVIIVETQAYPNSALTQKFYNLHSLLDNLQKLVQERPQLYMGYLITKQIQEEEQSVRRERLTDYEEKIYDQRRIVCDKQGFFESLLRPKKKRLPTQTIEEFQQIRAKEREVEQQLKTDLLFKQLEDIQTLKKLIESQQRNGVIAQKLELQSTKGTLSYISSTILGDQREFVTEKNIQLDTNADKERRLVRNSSLQPSLFHPPSPRQVNIQPIQQETKSLATLLEQICKFKEENIQLNKIYDQECLALKFKKGQCHKIIGQYQRVSKQILVGRQKLKQIKLNQQWRYQRCFQPVRSKRKTSSVEKGRYF